MRSMRIFALFIAIVTGATVAHGNVPIIVNTPGHQRAAMDLCSKASEQLRNGDIAGAKRNVDGALRIDPKLWPGLYLRAQIFRKEGKYELAIQDCNESLRKTRRFLGSTWLGFNSASGFQFQDSIGDSQDRKTEGIEMLFWRCTND